MSQRTEIMEIFSDMLADIDRDQERINDLRERYAHEPEFLKSLEIDQVAVNIQRATLTVAQTRVGSIFIRDGRFQNSRS